MKRIVKLGAVSIAALLALGGCAQAEVSNPSPAGTGVQQGRPPSSAPASAPAQSPTTATSSQSSRPASTSSTTTTKAATTKAATTKAATTRAATTRATTPRTSSTRTGPEPRAAVTQPPLGTKVDCSKAACVALTFDDGPGPRSGELLQMLVRANAPATFFMLSSVAANNKRTAAAIAANPNMEIANHSITHPNLRSLGAAGVNHQVITGKQRLEAQTGRKIDLFRPPYGASNANVRAAAARSGQAIIMWDVDTMDWSHRNSARVVSIALSQVRSGSIILMHDIHSSTVNAVPNLIKALNQRGYTLVTVGTLLGSTKGGQTYNRR